MAHAIPYNGSKWQLPYQVNYLGYLHLATIPPSTASPPNQVTGEMTDVPLHVYVGQVVNTSSLSQIFLRVLLKQLLLRCCDHVTM